MHTEPSRRRLVAVIAGCAGLGLIALGLIGYSLLAYLGDLRAQMAATSAQPIVWNYTLTSDGDDAVWESDGATVIFRSATYHGRQAGLITVAGGSDMAHDGGRTGFSQSIRNRVVTFGLHGTLVRIERNATRLFAGGSTFDLTQGRPVVEILPDGTAQAYDPLAKLTMTEEQAQRRSVKLWADGDQLAAIDLAVAYLEKYAKSQPLTFMAGACTRSCFDLEGAAPLMERVIALDPHTPHGQCAAHVSAIDRGESVETHFAALRELAERHSEDPLILWMLAVECRHLKKNEEGIRHYELLLKRVGKGSSLVHQTYASLLDAVGRHTDALPHRYAAVNLEPAEWSLDGLALTLEALGHYAASGQVMTKLRMKDYTPIGPAAVLVFSEAKRRRIYFEDAAIGRTLRQKYKGAPYSADVPELARLKRKHGLTGEQLAEIHVEGWNKKWERPQEN